MEAAKEAEQHLEQAREAVKRVLLIASAAVANDAANVFQLEGGGFQLGSGEARPSSCARPANATYPFSGGQQGAHFFYAPSGTSSFLRQGLLDFHAEAAVPTLGSDLRFHHPSQPSGHHLLQAHDTAECSQCGYR